MAEKNDNRDLLMKDAQYRKGLSIAFFNATNAAIEMMKATSNVTKENFLHWRDFLLDEHNDYYARVISQVGTHYDVKATIKRLKLTKNKPELTAVWMSLSQDEREHQEIKKIAYELRAEYLKTKEEVFVPETKKVVTKKKNETKTD